MTLPSIAIVGTGRVGLTLGRALARAGARVAMLGRSVRELPTPLAPSVVAWAPAISAADVVFVAVPDDAIGDVAQALADTGAVTERHVVLHCAGLYDRGVLSALDATAAALGSLHPLQTITVPDGDPDALAGNPAAVEGDARAVAVARDLATALGMAPIVELDGAGKRLYHVGAVVASNYVVVLCAMAERLARAAGAGDAAATLYLPIMRRALDNVAQRGAAMALSGPITRGDAGTVAAHLETLSGSDRALYAALGEEALRIARQRGLDETGALRIAAELRRAISTSSPVRSDG